MACRPPVQREISFSKEAPFLVANILGKRETDAPFYSIISIVPDLRVARFPEPRWLWIDKFDDRLYDVTCGNSSNFSRVSSSLRC